MWRGVVQAEGETKAKGSKMEMSQDIQGTEMRPEWLRQVSEEEIIGDKVIEVTETWSHRNTDHVRILAFINCELSNDWNILCRGVIWADLSFKRITLLLGIYCRGAKEWKQSDHLKLSCNNPDYSYWWLGVAIEVVRSSYNLNVFGIRTNRIF